MNNGQYFHGDRMRCEPRFNVQSYHIRKKKKRLSGRLIIKI